MIWGFGGLRSMFDGEVSWWNECGMNGRVMGDKEIRKKDDVWMRKRLNELCLFLFLYNRELHNRKKLQKTWSLNGVFEYNTTDIAFFYLLA